MKRVLTALLALMLLLVAGCAGKPGPVPIEVKPAAESAETVSPVPAAFAAIIAQYAEAEANGYFENVEPGERDAAFGRDTALEWRIDPQPAYYALHDLDGDGARELIIGAGEDPSALVGLDIRCDRDGAAVRPLDMDFGGRVRFELLADGLIAVRWSDSAFLSGVDLYRIEGAEARLCAAFAVESDPGEPGRMQYRQDGELIDEAEYARRLAPFESAARLFPDWLPVAAP